MFFKRLSRAVRHTLTLFWAMLSGPRRRMLGRIVGLGRELPAKFNLPLPQMMAQLTPNPAPSLPADEVRRLADAVAAWQVRSPLGICLRRSLLRFYFLYEAGLPVQIVFGARFKDSTEGGGIGGHAWLILNGQPYHENPQDYTGFVEMYIYPPTTQSKIQNRKS